MNSVLDVDSLSVMLPSGADRQYAVENISFSIHSGETLCLVGESGSGKSVIGQAILGMLSPALQQVSGSILFQNSVLPKTDSQEMQSLRGSQIAMIFQEPAAALNPIQRVGRQVEEVLIVHNHYSRTQWRPRVLELFESVGLPNPSEIYRSYPHQLSGGQCQRVVIAAALALKPKLLIADEPTTALDVTTQAGILELINTLKQSQDMAVLFITHDFGVVADIADRVIVMRDGLMVESGHRDELFAHPQQIYTQELLRAVPDLKSDSTVSKADSSEVVLKGRNLCRIYSKAVNWYQSRSFKAVDNISLDLRRGQTLGVVGESGSGKSTLLRCVLRLEPLDGGTICLDGADITCATGKQLQPLRKKFQVVLQDPYTSLNPRQKVIDTVAEGPIIHGVSKPEAQRQALEFLERVGLTTAAADRYPHEFSGGQRQRICIARALVLKPEILLADEAVSALDVTIQAQILDLFRDLQSELDFALLFVTHDLRVAATLCHDLIVMQYGKVVESGKAKDVFENPQSEYTQTLLQASPGKDVRFSMIGLETRGNEKEMSL